MAVKKGKYNFVDYKYDDETNQDLQAVKRFAPQTFTPSNYGQALDQAFQRQKNQGSFNYDPNNDSVYQQYASQARALNGLAMANNQQQAQGLTGGYGSTYAPQVANQGLTRLNDSVEASQPLFMQAEQEVYKNEANRLAETTNAANNMYSQDVNNQLNQFNQRLNDYETALKKYESDRDYGYSANQAQNQYELDYLATYQDLAANQLKKYAQQGKNGAMKSYLNKLVQQGKLTQYMADDMYDTYKVTRSSGGSGGGSRRSSNGKNKNGTIKANEITTKWIADHKFDPNKREHINKTYLNGNEVAVSQDDMEAQIYFAVQNGTISQDEALYLLKFYGIN